MTSRDVLGAGGSEDARLVLWHRLRATAVFEREWALEQLLSVLELAGEVAAAPFVLEQLAMVAPKTTAMSLRALRGIVESPGFQPYMARPGHIEQILAGALSHRKTCGDAKTLVDWLGARGYTHLGALIRTPSAESPRR